MRFSRPEQLAVEQVEFGVEEVSSAFRLVGVLVFDEIPLAGLMSWRFLFSVVVSCAGDSLLPRGAPSEQGVELLRAELSTVESILLLPPSTVSSFCFFKRLISWLRRSARCNLSRAEIKSDRSFVSKDPVLPVLTENVGWLEMEGVGLES